MTEAIWGFIGAIIGVYVTLFLNMVNNSALRAKIEIYDGWKRHSRIEERPGLERLRKQIVKRIRTMTWKDNAAVIVPILVLAATCFFAGRMSIDSFPQVPVGVVPILCLALFGTGVIIGRYFLDSEKPKNSKRSRKH